MREPKNMTIKPEILIKTLETERTGTKTGKTEIRMIETIFNIIEEIIQIKIRIIIEKIDLKIIRGEIAEMITILNQDQPGLILSKGEVEIYRTLNCRFKISTSKCLNTSNNKSNTTQPLHNKTTKSTRAKTPSFHLTQTNSNSSNFLSTSTHSKLHNSVKPSSLSSSLTNSLSNHLSRTR